MTYKTTLFTRFSKWIAVRSGHPAAFAMALLIVLTWLLSGPAFGFSDTWQLVINTGTTIVTFLMVFLIQNTQNRDSHAVQIKLDELIRTTRGAHVVLMDLEELSDDEIAKVRDVYEELARKARIALREGKADTGTPAIHIDAGGSMT